MIEYKSVSLANQVYDTLEYNILSGKYAYGGDHQRDQAF